MEVSLVIPTYNEEKRITNTLDQVIPFMEKHFKEYEIIIADDGSTDQTKAIVQKYSHRHLKILNLAHGGKGQAIKDGMLHAKGKHRFFMDADLPYPLESMLEAMQAFRQMKADLVIGARDLYKKEQELPYPWYRKMMSKSFSTFVNLVLNLQVPDTQCGFKGFSGKAAETIFPYVTISGFGFDFEMLFIARKHDFKIIRIPVNLSHTEGSKVRVVRDSIEMIKDALFVRINDAKGKYH